MTEQRHRDLLNALASIRGTFLLSGYPSSLYLDWAGHYGYRCVEIESDNKASSAKVKPKVTECVWMNYD